MASQAKAGNDANAQAEFNIALYDLPTSDFKYHMAGQTVLLKYCINLIQGAKAARRQNETVRADIFRGN